MLEQMFETAPNFIHISDDPDWKSINQKPFKNNLFDGNCRWNLHAFYSFI